MLKGGTAPVHLAKADWEIAFPKSDSSTREPGIAPYRWQGQAEPSVRFQVPHPYALLCIFTVAGTRFPWACSLLCTPVIVSCISGAFHWPVPPLVLASLFHNPGSCGRPLPFSSLLFVHFFLFFFILFILPSPQIDSCLLTFAAALALSPFSQTL